MAGCVQGHDGSLQMHEAEGLDFWGGHEPDPTFTYDPNAAIFIWPSPKHNDVIVLYDNEDTLTISDCWVLCPYHEEISYHYKDYVCKDVDIPATVIKITKTKHTVRFQGNIILGGDVELEWDDMLLGVNNIVFDSWFENLTVLEIRENWGIDIVRSFEVKQKANEN